MTPLHAVEVRVLGALVEKQITTPEYYPLSLNALVNACNQKSNREPWMSLDEDAARLALRNLSEKGLAGPARRAESRVPKFEHRLQEALNLTRGQTAIVCELLLRGPQTPGELRGRSERLHPFADLDEVQAALRQLIQREPALVAVLPRAPGTKEARYAHLLSGPVDGWMPPEAAAREVDSVRSYRDGLAPAGDSNAAERLARVEADLEALRAELADLRRIVAGLPQ